MKKIFNFLNIDKSLYGLTFEKIFINYFALLFISAIILLITNKDWVFNILFPLSIWGLLFKYRANYVKYNTIDVLWILHLFWIFQTWLFNDFPHKSTIVFYTIISHITYMMAYWISRKSSISYLDLIIRQSFLPFLFASIIGIYCFLYRPDWYMTMISNQAIEASIYTTDENVFTDAFRLRSIFGDAYTMSYFSALMLIFLSFYCVKMKWKNDNYNGSYITMLIIISIIVIVFCMMRAPIVCALLGFCLSLLMRRKLIRYFLIALIITPCVNILVNITFSKIDPNTEEYVKTKITSVTGKGNDEFVKERLFLMKTEDTLFGDGVGRHSVRADFYIPGTMLPDGEYMKIIQEEGYIGLLITILIFGIGLIKGLKNFTHLYLETTIILMLFICMIGANPLSTANKHCFIYWIALGQISKYFNKSV